VRDPSGLREFEGYVARRGIYVTNRCSSERAAATDARCYSCPWARPQRRALDRFRQFPSLELDAAAVTHPGRGAYSCSRYTGAQPLAAGPEQQPRQWTPILIQGSPHLHVPSTFQHEHMWHQALTTLPRKGRRRADLRFIRSSLMASSGETFSRDK
jgi:hypothetical protein